MFVPIMFPLTGMTSLTENSYVTTEETTAFSENGTLLVASHGPGISPYNYDSDYMQLHYSYSLLFTPVICIIT